MLPRFQILGWINIICISCVVFAEDSSELRHHKGYSQDQFRTPSGLDKRLQAAAGVQIFEKESGTNFAVGRESRETVASCLETKQTHGRSIQYGDDVNITCACAGTLLWFDESCDKVTEATKDHIFIGKSWILVRNFSKSDWGSIVCRSDASSDPLCSDKIDITATEPVKKSNGVVGVVVVIILAALVVMSLCFVRKYKTRISLCFRDTCQPNTGDDGKVYDAYVSTGVSETDRRFVDGFVNEVLRKKCGYNLCVDDKNILPRLDYSDKLQANLPKCRRLLVVFSASYMTHDWCMYCFNEGLRKLVDLHVQMIFVITDHSILSELQAHADLIAHVPQILLTQYQTSHERQHAVECVRQKMPPPMRSVSFRTRDGMRSPMLSDAESIHKSDINFNSNGSSNHTGNGTEYTFGTPPERITDDLQMEYDEVQELPEGPDEFVTRVQTGEEIDPDQVKIHEYNARKDFYSLTMSDEEV